MPLVFGFGVGLFAGTVSQFLISRWLKAVLAALGLYPLSAADAPRKVHLAKLIRALIATPSGWLLGLGIWLACSRLGVFSVPQLVGFSGGFFLGHIGLLIFADRYVPEWRRRRAKSFTSTPR